MKNLLFYCFFIVINKLKNNYFFLTIILNYIKINENINLDSRIFYISLMFFFK